MTDDKTGDKIDDKPFHVRLTTPPPEGQTYAIGYAENEDKNRKPASVPFKDGVSTIPVPPDIFDEWVKEGLKVERAKR